MRDEDIEQLLEDLLQLDGRSKYMGKIIEELVELQLAVIHYETGKATLEQVKDELADVILQLGKIVSIYKISTKDLDSRVIKAYKNLEEIVYYDPNYRD